MSKFFIDRPIFATVLSLVILIVGGVVPFCWIAWIALRNFRSGETVDELPEHPLYTTVAAGTDIETER